MFCVADSCPETVTGKLREAVLRLSVGAAAPFPLNATVCVPVPSTNVSVPVADPACVGAKVTCTWQLVSAARLVVPQELEASVNGAVIVTLVIGITAPPLLAA